MSRTKNEYRRMLKQRVDMLSADQQQHLAYQACKHVIRHAIFQNAERLMLYYAGAGELDTRPIIEAAWAAGKTVCLPQVDPDRPTMQPVVFRPDQPMTRDRFGIPTPAQGQVIAVHQLDLILVPGLGFDCRGRRLGRGGGFYDRLLAQRPEETRCCALAFACQLLPAIPIDPHDQPVDYIATEQWIRPASKTTGFLK